jgi:hypothetical protein
MVGDEQAPEHSIAHIRNSRSSNRSRNRQLWYGWNQRWQSWGKDGTRRYSKRGASCVAGNRRHCKRGAGCVIGTRWDRTGNFGGLNFGGCELGSGFFDSRLRDGELGTGYIKKLTKAGDGCVIAGDELLAAESGFLRARGSFYRNCLSRNGGSHKREREEKDCVER